MKKILRKAKQKKDAYQQQREAENAPPKNVPHITTTTVPEHREEVLSSARKLILPLQQSKHRIVLITVSLVIAALIAFFTVCVASLYKLQSSSTFIYKVSQIVPFPIARVGRDFVEYENYLFELRRYKHYYEVQQKLDFTTESGQQQLDEFKRRALDKVVDLAYIKQLAKTKNIKVSNDEVEAQVELLKSQNRLGNGDRVFEDVLQDYFGWSREDFKRYLASELLTQKVVAALDSETNARAAEAYAALQKKGAKFDKIAKKYSDDFATKNNGGELGFEITKSTRELSPQATEAIMQLKAGQTSKIINTGYSLEIFKVLKNKDGKAKAAHILFNFKDVSSYINDLKEQKPTKVYIAQPKSN